MRKQSETLSDLTSKTEATWIKDFPNLHGFLDPSPLGVHYLNQIAPYLHYPHELLNMFPGHFWRGGKKSTLWCGGRFREGSEKSIFQPGIFLQVKQCISKFLSPSVTWPYFEKKPEIP